MSLTAATLGVTPAATAQTVASMAPPKPASDWKFSASAAVKETFDSNVYLQSETDQANQESFVTSLLPQVAVAWNPSPAFGGSLGYSTEIAFFHSESSEDFVAHRATLSLSGKKDETLVESATSLVFIDGSSVGPTWTGPGGAPATGGPAVRDRRDAAVYRTSLQLTQNFEEWFVRPGFWFYLHDFQTDHRSTAGYQNYVDRNELLGGVDFGRRLSDKVSVWTAYRFGAQDQSQLLAFPEEYDNTFHRALVGVEGQPEEWLKVSIALGPEFRRYGDKVPAAFGDHDELNLFVDASSTVTPSKADTLTLSVKQFQQPGFGGRSAYKDLTCDFTWRHKLDPRWTVGLGGRAYNTDFLDPVIRNDWVLSANALVNCAVTSHLNAELSYVFEDGLTRDANASGREYDRHLVALGVKYVFR
jgi:hypothetical protein